MNAHRSNKVVPRQWPEGTVPLVSLEGSAYDCGREYAELVLSRYRHCGGYLDLADCWRALPETIRRLFERRAPHILELYRGLLDGRGEARGAVPGEFGGGCTSFSIAGTATLDGQPLSGQTKDTRPGSALEYIVLRVRIDDAPTILVLAYPGEVLGYGLWSNGMSIFRNNLYSTGGAENGLTMVQWGLLAMACGTAHEAAEIAEEYGLAESGNCLISDGLGESVCVEFNVGGVSAVGANGGISTHANHPVGAKTRPFAHCADATDHDDSVFRMERLRELLEAERGRLTAQKAMMLLADHVRYPRGICRHLDGENAQLCTTASVVAQPTRGMLSVVRGNPCSNWAETYVV